MTDYSSLCDDFYLYTYLNSEMELPNSRESVLHFFERVGKAFPSLANFYTREPGEFVLEEDKESGSYRWMSLEARRLASGYFNPPQLEEAHRQHELMLDLAPHLLSISNLDCEALDVMFGFDFAYKGNHDQIVGQAFAAEGRFESLMGIPNARLVNYEPTITVALDESCRLQCRVSVVTRTNSYQVRTGQFNEEAISIYFTIRQYWNGTTPYSFAESYRRQAETAIELLDTHVVPNIVFPLSEAISSG